MKVTVFGIGYVGLVQGAVLASVGHDVICVDVDKSKIEQLNQGEIPIFEPGLQTIVQQAVKNNLLRFTQDAKEGVKHGRIQMIAVGTPPDEDGSADLKYVLKVAQTIGDLMEEEKLVINKSTVPVGTAEQVKNTIHESLTTRKLNLKFDVASNPEFLKEGAAVNDCQRPDRIIVGTESEQVKDTMRELYAPFNRNHDRLIFMDVRSAELTKYAANCMLATKISFMNEIANIAEQVGADIEAVRQGIGSDTRIGYHFIYAGCGYGGSCFPKDVNALVKTANDNNYQPQILEAVEAVNKKQKSKLFEKLKSHFDGNLSGKTIAIWGLSFKPQTDDMRESPARVLMESLWNNGANVSAFDPEAMDECQRIYGLRQDLRLNANKESALVDADALVICTDWGQFKAPDFEFIKSTLRAPVIVDGRNLYNPEAVLDLGIRYYAIGRGLPTAAH